MDRMQQSEILGKLFSTENRTPECTKSPDALSVRAPGIIGPRRCCWNRHRLFEEAGEVRRRGLESEELKAFPGHSAMLSVLAFVAEALKSGRGLLSSSSYWKGKQQLSLAANRSRAAAPAQNP